MVYIDTPTKVVYQKAVAEVVWFDNDDVITTSNSSVGCSTNVFTTGGDDDVRCDFGW